MDAQQQEEEMASRSVQDGDDNIEAVTRSKEIEDILKCMRCTEKDAVVECRNCSPDQELGPVQFCTSCNDLVHYGNYTKGHVVIPLMHTLHNTLSEMQREFEEKRDELRLSVNRDLQQMKESIHDRHEALQAKLAGQIKEVSEQLTHQQMILSEQITAARDRQLFEFGLQEVKVNSILSEASKVLSHCSQAAAAPEVSDLLPVIPQLQAEFELSRKILDSIQFKNLSLHGYAPDMGLIRHYISQLSLHHEADWATGNQYPVEAVGGLLSSGHFWLGTDQYNVEVQAALWTLSQTLTSFMGQRPQEKIHVKSDMICCAYYSTERMWHRAVVEKVIRGNEKKVVVRYLDYGNTEEVPYNCVSSLPQDFLELPFQCRKCCFSDCSSDIVWKREAKWCYSDLTKELRLSVEVTKVEVVNAHLPVYHVKLTNERGEDVNARVIKEATTPSGKEVFSSRDYRFNRSHTPPCPTASSTAGTSPAYTDEESTKQVTVRVSQEDQDVPRYGSVTSLSGISQDSHKNEESSQEPASFLQPSSIPLPPSAASSTNSSPAHRRETKNRASNLPLSSALGLVEPSSLPLPPSESSSTRSSPPPERVVREEQEEGDPVTKPIQSSSQAGDSGFLETRLTSTVPVTLENKEGNRSEKRVDMEPRKEVKEKEEEEKEEQEVEVEKEEAKDEVKIVLKDVIHVENASQQKVDNEEFEEETDEGNTELDREKEKAVVPVISKIVDSTQYKAEEKEEGEAKTEVVIINKEEEEKEEVVPVRNETVDSTQHDEELTGTLLLPSSSSTPAKIMRNTVTEKETVECFPQSQIKEQDDQPPAIAGDTQDVAATDAVVEGGSERETRSLSKEKQALSLDLHQKVEEDTEVNVHVGVDHIHPMVAKDAEVQILVMSSLSANGTFWAQLQLDQPEEEKYSAMTTELQEYTKSNISYTPMFFSPGDLCIAVYSEDHSWYRGRVENIEQDIVSVMFMDFGNMEDVKLFNVMPLKSEFRRLPFQAIHCSVSTTDKDSFADHECDKFHSLTDPDERTLTALVICMEGSLVRLQLLVPDDTGTQKDILTLLSPAGDACKAAGKTRSYSFELPTENHESWAETMDSLMSPGVTAGEESVFIKDSSPSRSQLTDWEPAMISGLEGDKEGDKQAKGKRRNQHERDPRRNGGGSSARQVSSLESGASSSGDGSKHSWFTINKDPVRKFLGSVEKRERSSRDVPQKQEQRQTERGQWSSEKAVIPCTEDWESPSATPTAPISPATSTHSLPVSGSTAPHISHTSPSASPVPSSRSSHSKPTFMSGSKKNVVTVVVKGVPPLVTCRQLSDLFKKEGPVFDVRTSQRVSKTTHFVDMNRDAAMRVIDRWDRQFFPGTDQTLQVILDHGKRKWKH